MIADGEIGEGQGYKYKKDGQTYVECHVDIHPELARLGAELHMFGGLLSVRKPPGTLPIIIFGQDEAIFKQYLSWWKAWSGPGGLKAIWPKDDGLAVMISAIVSRELGFGVEWTDDLQRKANAFRSGKSYSDKDAAERLNGNDKKQDLMSSPFVIEFEHGANNEGYWRYENMCMQLEDCTDVLKVMIEDWGQEYEIVFMLDHSQNHNKHKSDGLNAKRMNACFAGAQPKMRRSKLDDVSCLGEHPNTLREYFEKVGVSSDGYLDDEDREVPLKLKDSQSMVSVESDLGPWYLSSEERKISS